MQMIKETFFVITLIFFLSGCAQLSHLQELLTLKAVSENRDLQAKYVKAQDKKFEQLLAAIKNNTIQQYTSQKQFLKEFGDPVFSHAVIHDGHPYELWLYRYAVKYSDSDKVYLYFDQAGKLQSWEHVVPEKKMVSNH